MDITTRQHKRCVAVAVSGRIDGATAPEFESSLTELTGQGTRNIVLDMSEVEFLSSSGLRVLLTTRKSLGKVGGRLALAQPSQRVTDTLDIAGIDILFDTYPDREGAIASF